VIFQGDRRVFGQKTSCHQLVVDGSLEAFAEISF
jgi:hypothetical protein